MPKKFPIPFRYPGGKFYALSILRPFWEKTSHDEYREPFVGGGSVFFNKDKAKFNWLNDKDSELIKVYEVMQDERLKKELIDRVSTEVASPERWREVLNFKPTNDIDIAFKYYYLNRTSFSGKLISPAWGYRPKRSLPPERWHERIEPSGSKLENVKITSLDFEDVINAPAQGKEVLIFVDPPYFKPHKTKHYRHGFEREDHERLAKVLKNTEHKFFLTYEDCPEVRELYEWAYVTEVEFFYRVDNSTVKSGSRQLGFELIISNYNISEQLKLL